ncbi:ATP-dependent RNA helicase HrpA [Carnimonas nigrificans]|uniref:ATP-dependent RNA helicase HrpA n=1 Tax=Carnimonas nigrificans TaxID=64323 RepID=UPI000471729D|nr:ATP-dependent RNA helicase HrpA [Carnimonas nigrificans]
MSASDLSPASGSEHDQLRALGKALDEVTLADAQALSGRLAKLAQRTKRGQPIDRALNDIRQRIAKSKAQVAAREARTFTLDYPESLPVSGKRADILKALNEHQVIVVAGETGSGKTTQLPKLCLECGLGRRGIIGHTQPRRLAARSVAARLAEELETPLGEGVGYQMRFADNTSADTRIKLMTDGILLAETQHDPDLLRYDAIIIDEAHERSLNIDFLLGYLKQLLARRRDLKLVITSATIDLERFADHFAVEREGKRVPAPIIEVSGRTFPVETRYRPLVRSGDDEDDISVQEGILRAVEEIEQAERELGFGSGPRDVLVFLPGEREIRETADVLRRAQLRHTEILPLYARLSAAEQNRVFAAHAGRRIVLSTNVAETSLTVPGIRYVIDPGLVRISRYSYRAKIQRLPIEPISQASAEQRKGRCGRVAAGLCIRLYSEDDFLARPAFTDPEIKRTNLAAVILSMLALKLGDIGAFPFIEPPDERFVRDGFRLLEELGAVDKQRITSVGRQLARFPVDPRLARMVLAGGAQGSLRETLIVVSALAVQDPRERPADKRQAADQAHREWADPASDFAGWIKLWQAFVAARDELSSSQLRRWCREHYLNYMRLREWHDTYRQLRQLAHELKLPDNELKEEIDYQRLHAALLTGLLSNLGLKQEAREYLGARNRQFVLHPASFVAKKAPKWVMAFELVETTRLYAREVAAIKPEWIEAAAGSLIKRSHAEPHWETKRGQVVALEQGTLFGLPIYAKRRVAYGHINPQEAREIFIRSALVEGQLATNAAFMEHNQALIDEVEQLEDKVRRRDILVDEEQLYDFYDQRLPADIYDSRSFDRWRKQHEQLEPRFLFVDKEALMARDAEEVTLAQYPEKLAVGPVELPLDYHFAPGTQNDGVTVTVPALMLNTLPRERFDWLVPGLRREKAIALLKGLPKQYRRQIVPIPDWVDAALEAIVPGSESMGVALGEFLRRKTGLKVDPQVWDEIELPDHLRTNFKVVDAAGKTLGQGRDLDQLVGRYRDAAPQTAAGASAAHSGEQQGLKTLPETPLAEQVEREQAGIRITLYPAFVDEGDSIGIKFYDHPDAAERSMRQGVARAAMLALPEQLGYFRRDKRLEALAVLYTQVGSKRELISDLGNTLFINAFAYDPLPRSASELRARLDHSRGQLGELADTLIARTEAALKGVIALKKQLKKARIGLDVARSYADVKSQLARLVYPGFIATAGEWLEEYPRYIEAARLRLEKVARETRRDQLAMDEVTELEARLDARFERARQSGVTPAWLQEFFWQLQELRVSLFAQQLGTKEAVSVKRLERRWKELSSAH